MIYLLIVVIALVFLPRMEIALYPSIDLPVITVMVDCNDAGPEEIEQQVAKELEDMFSSLENLNTITSVSSDGSCIVVLEFDYGTDLDDAEEDLNSYITMASALLPSWTETPQTFRLDSMSSSQVVSLMLTSDSLTLDELKMLGDNTVAPLIERIPGVGQVNVFGGTDVEYHINADPNRLEAYGISLSEIVAAVSSDNVQATGGEITDQGINYQVAADERYVTESDIGRTVIKTIDGVPIRIEDVADVVRGADTTQQSESYVDGERVITLSVSNDSDSNATTVASDVIAQLDAINSELPEGTVLSLQRDSTEMIRDTMSEAINSLLQGVVLAALIIWLFLRGIKTTIIISLSMPICVLITMMIMSICGITINAMSMSGLILGIGMIVDASIVILENTYSYRQLGEKSAVAAILGSKNMFNAIFASTMTTLCVFVPVIIFKYDLEMIGIMFQDIVITVCISLACSLFVAVTLVPALCGSILRINTRTQKPLRIRWMKKIDDALSSFEKSMNRGYVRVLAYFMRHRFLLVMLLVLLLAVSLKLFGTMGFDLIPQQTTDDEVTLSLELDQGTSIDVTRGYVFDMYDKILEALPEESYESIQVNVGGGGMMSSENSGSITVKLPDITNQSYSAAEIQNIIRPMLYLDPNADWTFDSSGIGISAIDVEIHSEDSGAALDAANSIAAIMREHVSGATNISTDADNGAPKVRVNIDKDLAAQYGITMSSVTGVMQSAITGITATEITTFSTTESYDVVVMADPETISTIDQIGSLLIPSSSGMVRLDTIAELEMTTTPVSITRENKVRINHVTADLLEGYSASEVQNELDSALDEYLVLPEGVTIEQAGQMSEMSGYLMSLVMIVLLALFLVYAVMAAQFESLIDPFIIFATIPLLMIGVIWIHILYGQSFSLMSVVGIVALIGVVVNNGIVLVDCINRLVRQHVPVRQACLQAAYGRLRPILMTTLTTILGLIPMAFFPGDGAEMLQPIALTFTGGILTGAFLTLLLSPVLYSLFNERREKKYDDPESLTNQLMEYDGRRLMKLDDFGGGFFPE